MPTTFLQSLLIAPGFWSFSLGAVVAVCSCASMILVARYRFWLNLYRAQTDRIVAARELAMAERQIVLDEIRLLDVERQFAAQASRPVELEPKASASQIEKKAA